jgi:peptide/nickel transport system substrate-binding protein
VTPTGRTTVTAAFLVLVTAAAGCFAGTSGEQGEQRLQVGLFSAPRHHMSPYADDASIITKLGAAETLVEVDPAGTVTAALAESWSTVDSSTVRLRLRPGVVFHDGTPLTSAAAAAALTNATRAKPVPRALNSVQLTATAADGLTLDLRTAKPDPMLLHRLASPQLVVLAPKAYEHDPGAPDPIGAGTGPYRLAAVQGTSSATLHRFDAYWGGRPKLAGLDVRFLPDGSARAGALRTGEVDVVNALPIAQVPNLGDRPLIEIPLPRTVSLYLVGGAGRPFADPGLRAVARAAADPAAITASVYEGRGDAAAGLFGPASAWAPAGRIARTTTANTAPPDTKITLASYPERPELPEVASAISAALTERGFEVETVVRSYATLEPEILAGHFDAVLLSRSYLVDSGDPIAFLASDFGCAGSYNLARFCDPGFDAEVAAAAGLEDQQARLTAVLALEADLLDQAVIVPLVHERALLGHAPGVAGLAHDPYERALVTARTVRR